MTDFILRHKVALSVGAGLLVLLAIAYAINSNLQSKKFAEYGNQLFHFQKNELADFEEGKIEVEEFLAKYRELIGKMSGYPHLAYQNLYLSDLLLKRGLLLKAKELLEEGLNLSTSYLNYFYLTRLAVVCEDLQQYPQAISYLQRLLQGKMPVQEGKVYLDLGRLQLLTGERETAKKSFEWVVEKAEEEEWRKMAELYLSEF